MIARLPLQPAPGAAAGHRRRWPLERLRRLTGRLARENAQRNPSRTAVTAAALMIGLALVTFVTVFSAGLKSSVAQVVDENFAGGLVIQNSDGFSPIPNGTAAAARKVPGVELVATIRSAQAKLIGSGADADSRRRRRDIGTRRVKVEWKQGGPATLRDLTDDQAVVADSFASDNDLEVGDSFRLLSQTRKRPTLRSRRRVLLQARGVRQRADHAGGAGAGIRPDPGHDRLRQDRARAPTPATVQALLTKVVEVAFPTAEVLNQQELKESREKQVDQLVNLVFALLALAIVISLFGIANTLALSIHERTRELGMLRAIGMSRRQVRTMIRYEAVITALIGAILGMVLGADLRGADRAAAQGRRLHALLPDRLAGRAADPGRARRGAGGDRTGPACLPARRARVPAVRVAAAWRCACRRPRCLSA